MCLKVVEKDAHKDIPIAEGEVGWTLLPQLCFPSIHPLTPSLLHPLTPSPITSSPLTLYQVYMHPSRIPHSPQRYDNTVGLVWLGMAW